MRIVFHGANPAYEGEDFSQVRDASGLLITQELFRKADAGGGFVEYLWPNFDLPGNPDSPKVGYARYMTIGNTKLVIGSGFYPPQDVPVAPVAAQLLLAALLLAGGAYRRWRQP